MKSAPVVWAAMAAAGIVCLGFLPKESRAEEQRSQGKEIYLAQCAMCHGENGRGDGRAALDFRTRPTDLTDPELMTDSDGTLIRRILHAPRPMPKFKDLLEETERHELVTYLRTLSKTQVGVRR